nr:MAG TPA: hypothetical protein [Caudoviricetes sp.]
MESPHTSTVTAKAAVIGGRSPYRHQGARRLTPQRMSGFFVRANHLLTGEACGRLRGGRYLDGGTSYPAAPRPPAVGSGRGAPKNSSRSSDMHKASPAAVGVLANLASRMLAAGLSEKDAAALAADLGLHAQSVLTSVVDALASHSPIFDRAAVSRSVMTALDLLEAQAVLLDSREECK